MLVNGKVTKVSADTKADYTITKPSSFFTPVTNLIPTLSAVSGARVLLGEKSSLQAMTLINREAPLVQPLSSGDKSFHELYGKQVSLASHHDGEVHHISDDSIKIKDNRGDIHDYPLYNYHIMGRESYLHHTPSVKVGDKVKQGDLLAHSNYSDKQGALALGMNLKTAIMPYRSKNFEDAFVISESAAKKLEAEQLLPIRLELMGGIETNKDKYISLFPNKFVNSQLAKIDSSGVVRKGQIVKNGDPIILAYKPKTLKSLDLHLGKLARALRNAYSDVTITWELEHDGEVVDVAHTAGLITITIKTTRSMSYADKLSNSFGAKGVVTVVSDAEMPQGEDGKPIDVLLNSMSITSRVAPALPITMALGKVAQKTGKAIKLEGFTPGSLVKQTIENIDKHGIKDIEKVYDPLSGTHMEVFTGPLYYTRLHHIAEDKVSSRAAATSYDINAQPARSGEDSSKRIGSLGTTVALSNDAKAVLRDMAVVRATKNDDFWTALKLGHNPPPPKVPFIFHKFVSHLEGAGVNFRQEGERFNIFPQTDKDIEKLSNGAITQPLTYKLKKDELIPEAGGLFDPEHTGIYGDKYNHIDLSFKITNPISEDYIRKLLGITKNKFDEMLVSGELEKTLNGMDLDKEITKTKSFLKSAKKSGRDNQVKVLSFLLMLKEQGMQPKDLLLSKVPVIPAQYRPIMAQGKQILSADVNELYKDLLLVNNTVKENKELSDIHPELINQAKKKVYDGVKAVYGLGDPISSKSVEKGYKGLLATALGFGSSAKESMYQAKVVNKPLDLTGRAVLLPDHSLGLNEASIPQTVAWNEFSPFVVRRLVRRGVPATKAVEYVKNKHPMARECLLEEMVDRPGIVTRDPLLNKYGFQGFYLKMNPDPKDYSIKLHPLTFAPFGGDSDGDQLNIQLPASEDAKEEIKEKLIPDKNLISHSNFGPVYIPSNESATGLFAASYEKNDNNPHKFKSEEEVVKAYLAGKLNVGDNIEIA